MPVSVERLDHVKDTDENVDADHIRTGRLVESDQPPGLFTQREEIDIDFRVCVDCHMQLCNKPKTSVFAKLVKKLERHPHREAPQADLQQNNAYNPFSDESTAMIREMGKIKVRNNSKSAMLRMPSLLDPRSSLLHLWTSLG